MNSYFDLLVLAALFVPVALMVAANLAAYRSPGAGDGLLGLPMGEPTAVPEPARAACEEAAELPELREAA
ncbi:MAG TPA: hypothetical protein VFJ86_08955 [Usitatibacter sp.]|jgi:hypothetical protein|nr:hypothetical protein [Usitatibacter sp.]